MSTVWPFDEYKGRMRKPIEAIRGFKCLLLMPFDARFNPVAALIEKCVREALDSSASMFLLDLPEIKRLDWITSSNAIHHEIWREIAEADLVFCDITGYNPNVMFEAGVCSAWKKVQQVIFIKDRFFKQQSAFDIAPIRYTEYELTSTGVPIFEQQITKLATDALLAFPDSEIRTPTLEFPIEMEFRNSDDLRLYTTPFAHRRVMDGMLEFGSVIHYAHSWASIGQERLANFELEFIASATHVGNPKGFIGVGLRSQHYLANYEHVVYLGNDGRINLAQPDDQSSSAYRDHLVRPATPIDAASDHHFRIGFSDTTLDISIDDWSLSWDLRQRKTLGPGLIRFQSSLTWMRLRRLRLSK